MKCPIFLLAFCAYETVFAVNPTGNPVETPFLKQLGDLHHRYTTELEDVLSNFHDSAEDLVALTQPKNTQVSNCLEEHRELQRYYEYERAESGFCYRNALRHGSLKQAERCYLRLVINLAGDSTKRQQEIRVCIKAILDGENEGEIYTIRRALVPGNNRRSSRGSSGSNTVPTVRRPPPRFPPAPLNVERPNPDSPFSSIPSPRRR